MRVRMIIITKRGEEMLLTSVILTKRQQCILQLATHSITINNLFQEVRKQRNAAITDRVLANDVVELELAGYVRVS